MGLQLPTCPVDAAAAGVRSADPSDLEAIASLHLAACREAQRRRGGEVLVAERQRGTASDAVRSSLHVELDHADRRLLAGCLGECVVGYAVVHLSGPTPGVAEIRELFVEPDARGIGVGTGLLATARAAARTHGCSGIDAVALPGDRSTKNFFEDHAMVARAIIVHAALEP